MFHCGSLNNWKSPVGFQVCQSLTFEFNLLTEILFDASINKIMSTITTWSNLTNYNLLASTLISFPAFLRFLFSEELWNLFRCFKKFTSHWNGKSKFRLFSLGQVIVKFVLSLASLHHVVSVKWGILSIIKRYFVYSYARQWMNAVNYYGRRFLTMNGSWRNLKSGLQRVPKERFPLAAFSKCVFLCVLQQFPIIKLPFTPLVPYICKYVSCRLSELNRKFIISSTLFIGCGGGCRSFLLLAFKR